MGARVSCGDTTTHPFHRRKHLRNRRACRVCPQGTKDYRLQPAPPLHRSHRPWSRGCSTSGRNSKIGHWSRNYRLSHISSLSGEHLFSPSVLTSISWLWWILTEPTASSISMSSWTRSVQRTIRSRTRSSTTTSSSRAIVRLTVDREPITGAISC